MDRGAWWATVHGVAESDPGAVEDLEMPCYSSCLDGRQTSQVSHTDLHWPFLHLRYLIETCMPGVAVLLLPCSFCSSAAS